MIPAIDPGFGLKEDQPKPKVLQTGGADFHSVLRKSSRSEGGSSSQPLKAARRPGEPRARSVWSESQATRPEDSRETERPSEDTPARKASTGKPREGERKHPGVKDAGGKQDGLEDAAPSTPSPHLEPATADSTIVAEQETAPDLAELALNQQGEAQTAGSVHTLTPGVATVGQAAWRLTPHGQGEAQAAAQNGLVLPGSDEAALMQAAQRVGDSIDQMEPSDELKAMLKGDKPLVDPDADVGVRLKSAKAEDTLNEQIQLEAARGRAKLMQQLAAVETAAGTQSQGTATDAALERNLFLQNQLQRSGMLVRTGQPAKPEASKGGEMVGVGQVSAFASPKPGQIFEMPTDPAVEHRAMERVASEARWLINNHRQEVRFRLTPEHLGTLHMKIVREDGVTRVDMLVDNHSAKQLLESNLDSLREQLAQGSTGGEFLFNVDIRQGHDESSLQSRYAGTPAPGTLRTAGLEAEAEAAAPGRVLSHSGLSIYA